MSAGLTRREFVWSSAAFAAIRPLRETTADVVSLSPGLTHHVVVREGELAPTSVQFVPGASADAGALWIGDAFVRLARGPVSNRWTIVRDERYGKRISNLSDVTAATPWGTLLVVDAEGSVLELDPTTSASKRLPALGRHPRVGFALTQLEDGRPVVYSGSLFKFVADRADSLETGTLYAASFETNRWLPVTHDTPISLRAFKDQDDMLLRARHAAELVGASRCKPLPVLAHRSLVRFGEQTFDDRSLTFEPSRMLWPTDRFSVRDSVLNLNRRGLDYTIAHAPRSATFSTPALARNEKTVFTVVRQGTVSDSHWPDGGNSAPRSAVIAIEGEFLGSMFVIA